MLMVLLIFCCLSQRASGPRVQQCSWGGWSGTWLCQELGLPRVAARVCLLGKESCASDLPGKAPWSYLCWIGEGITIAGLW